MEPIPSAQSTPPILPQQKQTPESGDHFSLDGLLPIIRSIRVVRSFRQRVESGVAVFRGSLVIFRSRNANPLPDEVFVEDEGAALLACKAVQRARKFAYADIDRVEATLRDAYCHFIIRLARKPHWFSRRVHRLVLLRQESRHVVEALRCLLPARFRLNDDGKGWRAPARGWWGIATAWSLVAGGLAVFGLLEFLWLPVANHRPADPDVVGGIVLISYVQQYSLLIALLAIAYLFNTWLNRVRQNRKAGKTPTNSPVLGFVCRLLGVLLVLAGYTVSYNVAVWLYGSTALGNGADGGDVMMDAFLSTNAMTNLLIGTGILFLYLGYRLSLGLAATKLDEFRPPVLYLRSFGDDGRHSLTPRVTGAAWLGLRPLPGLRNLGPLANTHPVRILRLAVGRAMDTAEEQLAAFFRKVGPFVAIGQPGESLVTGGAARIYVDDNHWKGEVLDLMKRAVLIVLQPAESEGVWHEIRSTRALAAPQRVLMSLASFQESEQRYEEFRLRFEGFLGCALPRNVRSVLFLRFDADWKPLPVRAVFHSPFFWPLAGTAVNLKRTLESLMREIHSGTVTASAHRLRLPRASLTIAAGILWTLAILATVGCLSYYSRIVASGYQLLGLVNQSPRQSFSGERGIYTWHLGRGWKVRPEHLGDNITVYGDANDYVRAVVSCAPNSPPFGNPRPQIDAVLDTIRNQGRTIDSEERRTVQSTGRSWLQVTATSRDKHDTFLEMLRGYDGPDAGCILRLNMKTTGLHWEGHACEVLTRILDQFELPPLTPEQRELAAASLQDATADPLAVAHRFESTGMTVRLGKGWTTLPLNNMLRCYRFLGGHETELFLFRSDALPNLGTVKAILENLLKQFGEPDQPVNLAQHEVAQASNPSEMDFSADTMHDDKGTHWECSAWSRPDGFFAAFTAQRNLNVGTRSDVAHLLELARRNVELPPEETVVKWVAPPHTYHLKLPSYWKPADKGGLHLEDADSAMKAGDVAMFTVRLEKPQPNMRDLAAFTPQTVEVVERADGAEDIAVTPLGVVEVAGTKWARFRAAYKLGQRRLVSWLSYTQTDRALYNVEAYCAETNAEKFDADMIAALNGVVIDTPANR